MTRSEELAAGRMETSWAMHASIGRSGVSQLDRKTAYVSCQDLKLEMILPITQCILNFYERNQECTHDDRKSPPSWMERHLLSPFRIHADVDPHNWPTTLVKIYDAITRCVVDAANKE